MEILQQILARWWARILLFLSVGFVASIIFDSLYHIDIIFYASYFFLIILTLIIESLRKGGKCWTVGLRIDKWATNDILHSVYMILGLITFIYLISFFINGFSLSNIIIHSGFYSFDFFLIITIFIAAANEELLFRGIIFQALVDRFGFYLPTILMSLLFSLAHLSNGVTMFSLANIFIAGILFSIMYLQTRSLWLPIFFHFLWNFSLAFLLGSKVSGYHLIDPLLELNLHKYSIWLFGTQEYGLESGFITTIALLTFVFIVFKLPKVSPFMSSQLYKMQYFEAKIINRPKMFNTKLNKE